MTDPQTTPKNPKDFFSTWTDEMIRNHIGQSRTKQEIEEIVGRRIDWNEKLP